VTAAAASSGDAPPQPRGGADPRLEFEDADPTLVAAQADTGNRTPPYPDEAYQQNEEGTVVVRLHIAGDGRVERVEIRQSSGSPWLDEAAQKTLGTWHFLPARRDGQPVRSYRDQPVHFVLQ
jgi:protein TonB